jgi:hypothetical protein
LRVPEATIAAIDRHADNQQQTRSEAIRRILTGYLKRRGLLGDR